MADEREEEREEERELRGEAAAEKVQLAHRAAMTKDRSILRRLDEKETRDRAIEAWDHFVAMGFSSHLIAVQVRGAVEYRIALYPDGQRTLAVELLTEAAKDFNFDLQMERDESYPSGWAIYLYPLT